MASLSTIPLSVVDEIFSFVIAEPSVVDGTDAQAAVPLVLIARRFVESGRRAQLRAVWLRPSGRAMALLQLVQSHPSCRTGVRSVGGGFGSEDGVLELAVAMMQLCATTVVEFHPVGMSPVVLQDAFAGLLGSVRSLNLYGVYPSVGSVWANDSAVDGADSMAIVGILKGVGPMLRRIRVEWLPPLHMGSTTLPMLEIIAIEEFSTDDGPMVATAAISAIIGATSAPALRLRVPVGHLDAVAEEIRPEDRTRIVDISLGAGEIDNDFGVVTDDSPEVAWALLPAIRHLTVVEIRQLGASSINAWPASLRSVELFNVQLDWAALTARIADRRQWTDMERLYVEARQTERPAPWIAPLRAACEDAAVTYQVDYRKHWRGPAQAGDDEYESERTDGSADGLSAEN